MHDGRTRLRLGTAANRSFRWLAVLFPISIVGSVLGQGYLVPPPGYQGAPAVPTMGNVIGANGPAQGDLNSQSFEQLNALATGDTGSQITDQPNAQPTDQGNAPAEGDTSGTAAAALAAPVTSLMSWGALHVHVRASYQFSYATGIHSDPGNSADTFTHTFTPGLTLNVGPHVSMYYSPSFRIYSQKDFHNTIDQSMGLNGGLRYGDWTFGTTHGLSIADDPLVETSTQTRRMEYAGSVFASYQFNDKISLVTSAGANLEILGTTNSVATNGVGGSAELSDSQKVNGGESLNYTFDEYLTAGIGVTIDYSQQDSGFRSLDEQYNAHVDWHPSAKLTASVSAGIERLHFLNGNADTAWNPIYSASISYQLFEQTSFSLYANHTINSSLFRNEITENTALGIGFQQRLLGKLRLSLGFGYTASDYKTTTTPNLSTSRSDEGTSYSAGLSLPFLTHCDFSTYYSYSQNTSSASLFGYSSSQVGMTLSWTY